MRKGYGRRLTLHGMELVPVTDPAQLAALARPCRAAVKAMTAAGQNAGKGKSTKRK